MSITQTHELSFPTISKTKFRFKFRDQIETNFHGLKALSIDHSTHSKIVVLVLVEKLPERLKFCLVRSCRKSILEWDLEGLIAELYIELEVRENHADILKFSGRPRQEYGGPLEQINMS